MSNNLNKIRQPLFSGRCAVRAVWFDLALLGEAEARRRVLAHWQAGSRLFGVHGGYLLEWPRSAWHHVDQLDGLALCEVGHVLSSAPLTGSELATLPIGAYWLVRDASALAAIPDERIDPSPWLALDAIALREPLRFPSAPGEAAQLLPEDAKPLREILGDSIPAASEESLEFMRNAARLAKDGAPQEARIPGGAAAKAALSALGLMASWAASMLPKPKAGPAQTGAGPGQLSQMAKWLNDLAVRLANASKMSELMGKRQANYLRKMMDMFDDGDLFEALRHAIPLGGEDSGRQAFGTPSRRHDLSITGGGGASSQINMAPDLQQRLRNTYRRSFEKLDREGRIDEAVFVLAELLKCGAEAVTYLEGKKRYKQAAELAATLALPAQIGVRLWILAGDVQRAVKLARLHNEFSVAVQLLEARQSEHAAPLRREWAEFLAARGDLIEAIDVIWPLPQHHALALACLVQADRAGGTLGMRALARKLALLPNMLRACAPAIEAVLAASGEEGARLRARLACELIGIEPKTPSMRKVAGVLARVVIAERHQGLNLLDNKDLKSLVTLAEAAVLNADLPSAKPPPPPAQQSLYRRVKALELAMPERGLLTIHDARPLPDDEYLLALGETGVVRVNRHGKQLARYPIPAESLVLADNGRRALGLIKRDDTYRISRLDLITGKVADWLCLPLLRWSERYDGVTWNVALDKRLVAIDTTAPQLSITWQVSDLPGRLAGYVEGADMLTLLLGCESEIEQWSYALPGREMRQRDAFDYPPGGFISILPVPGLGAPYVCRVEASGGGTQTLHMRRQGDLGGLTIALGEIDDVRSIQIKDGWVLVLAVQEERTIAIVAGMHANGIKARIQMHSADGPRMNVHAGHVLVFDHAGRLLDIDIETAQINTLSLT